MACCSVVVHLTCYNRPALTLLKASCWVCCFLKFSSYLFVIMKWANSIFLHLQRALMFVLHLRYYYNFFFINPIPLTNNPLSFAFISHHWRRLGFSTRPKWLRMEKGWGGALNEQRLSVVKQYSHTWSINRKKACKLVICVVFTAGIPKLSCQPNPFNIKHLLEVPPEILIMWQHPQVLQHAGKQI